MAKQRSCCGTGIFHVYSRMRRADRPECRHSDFCTCHRGGDRGDNCAPELTERAKKLLAQNPDTVGYITIEGSQVDNPVVQTSNNEYYLDHGFDGQEFRAGTVFMDCTDDFGADPETWSENIVLYGHNMADNTMFGSLRQYRQNPSYYKEAPFITFSSNYADYTYVMVGLLITGGDADSDLSTGRWKIWTTRLPSTAIWDRSIPRI